MSTEHDVHSLAALDLERYLGTWFEIGRLPMKYEDDGARDVTATYTLQENGAVRVDNRCLDDAGRPTQSLGEATPVQGEPAQLTVSFLPAGLRWIPFTEGDYWVLKIDPDYRVSLVGTPDRKNLWLLAREHRIEEATRQAYLAEARAQGFDLSDWIDTPQSGGRVQETDLADH